MPNDEAAKRRRGKTKAGIAGARRTGSARARPDASLGDFFKDHIKATLLEYQDPNVGGGREGVLGALVELMLNPLNSPYSIANRATVRLEKVSRRLKEEFLARNVGPWVIPRAAALTVEWVFESCVAFWLARGDPADPRKLRPEVEKYVDLNVKALLAVLGAQRA